MTQQVINVGAAPNDGTGNTIRQSFTICNSNFSELYSRAQVTPPATLVGTVGDFAGMYAYDSTYFYYCYANYDGSSQIWAQVTQVGNVSVTSLNNGNSNIAIANPDGNATISIDSVSNVAVITSTGATVTGRLSTVGNIAATGNVTASYFLGNGSQLTGLPDAYGNSNVASYLPTYTGNIAASTISATGNITTDGYFVGTFFGNITGNFVVPGANTQVLFNTNGNADAVAGLTFDTNGNVLSVLGVVTAAGNVTGGNILTAGLISATGNVTGNIITGIINATNPAGGAAAIALDMNNQTIGSVNNIIYGDSGPYEGLEWLDGANWALFDSANDFTNVTGNLQFVSGNISNVSNTAAYTRVTFNTLGQVEIPVDIGTAPLLINSTTLVDNLNANLLNGYNTDTANTANTIVLRDSTGNITGNYIFGNGSLLTGIITSVANINSGTSNVTVVSSGGNISVSVGGTSNVVVWATTGEYVTGEISATGNVTGGNVSGTNLTGTLTTAAQTNITSVGTLASLNVTANVQGGNLLTAGLISATGNITGGNISATNHTGTTISVTGNVTANNFIGNSVVASTGNLNLTSGSGSATQVNGGGTFRLPSFTTAQLANITGVPGDLVYNTTDNKVQAWQYDATSSFAWVSLSVSTYQ